MVNTGETMTIADVAQITGKSEQSVRRAIKAGKLKATMIETNGIILNLYHLLQRFRIS